MNIDRALIESDLDSLKLIKRGKVRDLYEIDQNRILIVQTDRVSAFDKVFPNGIASAFRSIEIRSSFHALHKLLPLRLQHLLFWGKQEKVK